MTLHFLAPLQTHTRSLLIMLSLPATGISVGQLKLYSSQMNYLSGIFRGHWRLHQRHR